MLNLFRITLLASAVLALAACGGAPQIPLTPPPAQPAQPTQPSAEANVAAAAPTAAPMVAPVSEPTLVPQPTAAPTLLPVSQGTANFNGTTFNFDLSVAQQVTGTTVPAQNPGADAPYWAVVPAYDELNLIGYASQNTYHKPRVEVYAVAEFEQMNQAAKEQIERLRQLLADAPAAPDSIPLLPIFNAAQMFRSNVKYLNFQSGQGVRFVTQYGQAVMPVNNQEIFYTFQGLTSDGQWYVAAILPVSTGSLPATSTVSQEQMAFMNSAEAFEKYLAETVGQLNGQGAETFVPNLDALDALVQSIHLEK